jgi:hypothetical protein
MAIVKETQGWSASLRQERGDAYDDNISNVHANDSIC